MPLWLRSGSGWPSPPEPTDGPPAAQKTAPGTEHPGRSLVSRESDGDPTAGLRGRGWLLVLACWGRGGLQRFTLCFLTASLLEGTPSVSGTTCGSEHVGELIEEATKSEEENR
ncbi:hypothetical protein TUSST3_83740 [Streptomyces sp. TUS-ST3]|nr:hypothetical protein TUSST3_83740 [Streptomyces sp. TUS-ST3]